MEYRDYYKILDVQRAATKDEINKAYRRLARKYHPDLNPGDKAAEARFKEINEAHEVLTDPEKRKKYDALGPNGGRPGFDIAHLCAAARRTSQTRAPGEVPTGANGAAGESFSDFFQSIFGQTARQAGARDRPPAPRSRGAATISSSRWR